MAEHDHQLGAGRRRHRRPHARRPEPVGQHDEPRLRGIDGRDDRPAARPRRTRSRASSSPRRRRPSSPAATSTICARPRKERRAEIAEMVRERQGQLRRLETLGKPVVAAINGAALGGGLEICAGLPPPRRVDDRRSSSASPRSSSACCRARGGVVRTVRMFGIVDALMKLLLQGQRRPARQGAGDGPRRRDRRHARRARARREGVDRGAAGRRADGAAVGRQGLQDPRRHAVEPEARAEPAGVPGEPAQAAQGRELPGAAPHHGRGGRGRAGRLRQRDRDRGPLLRRPGHRPGREEHDPGVLLRPAARSTATAAGRRASSRFRPRRSSCSAPA